MAPCCGSGCRARPCQAVSVTRAKKLNLIKRLRWQEMQRRLRRRVAVGRTVAALAANLSSRVIYLTRTRYLCALKAICERNAAINCVTVRRTKKRSFLSNTTRHTALDCTCHKIFPKISYYNNNNLVSYRAVSRPGFDSKTVCAAAHSANSWVKTRYMSRFKVTVFACIALYSIINLSKRSIALLFRLSKSI